MDKLTEQKIADGRIVIQSPLDFHFQSNSDSEDFHTVDLRRFNGSGACWCENFRFRIEPKLKSGKVKPHESGSHCKHIVTARLILGDRLISATIRKLSHEEKEAIEEEDRNQEEVNRSP